MDQYDCLNKAQLSFEYLHTNSTTHTFLFGALAELVDNSRDAGARNLDVYTCPDTSLRGGFYLSFLDDGCGMHFDDVFNVIVFGKSSKRHTLDSSQIGQYGNGLKSGAMRIANDLILFTKKDQIGTCLFLSRTFHLEEHISQIMCPMPCFDLTTGQPINNTVQQQFNGTRTYNYDQAKHELEMHLITKYSPFKTVADLLKQFELITSLSGTLIILYNVKLSDHGEAELDIKTDPLDILIDSKNRRNLFDDDEDSTPPEYRSLRAYVSILYYEPRMRITIQRRHVITKKLPHTLYKPRQYQFKSTRFKTRSEQEIKQSEKELHSLEERVREADSQVYDLQQRLSITTTLDERSKLRKLQINAAELKDVCNRLRNGLARKKTELHTTKTLTLIFGLNISNRAADGVFIYNCGRLIKMYEKIGQPNKKTLYCRGVIGVVDVPSIVLQPTHNKQSFADEKEYHFLLKNMGDYMRQYWTDTGIEHYVKEFWETYGYRDDQLDRPPSKEPEIVKRRQAAVPLLIQCDQCLKWRRLPYSGHSAPLSPSQLESWCCSDNTDILNNLCSIVEKVDIIPEGELVQRTSVNHAQNRQTSRASSPSARLTGTVRRVSNAEISSSTNHPKGSTHSTMAAPSSTSSRKRSLCPLLSRSSKTKKKSIRPKAKSSKILSDDEEEPFTSVRSSHSDVSPPNSVTSTNPVLKTDDDHNEIQTDHLRPTPPTIGARVWAMYQGARRAGRVVTVNDEHSVFKMRFDDFPSADSDYSFSYTSTAWSYVSTPPPSSHPVIASIRPVNSEEEPLSAITKKFKTLIKFMLPPDWALTRDEISAMTYDDLSQFDVTAFMHSYREKMSKMLAQRKTDEALWRTSVQRLQTEVTDLLNLSGMPIPNDCTINDFDQHIQKYTEQVDQSI